MNEKPKTPRILVVDDEPAVLEVVTRILKVAGFEVLGISESLGVAEAARRFRPNLVLMDMDMPELDGSELCTLLKSQPEMKGVPVVFLSGRTLDADRDLALFSGASAYLDKPVDAPALVRTVRSLLGARSAAPAGARRIS
jgi:CheY-like chemotaxis protein